MLKLRVEQDEDPINPRKEYDNASRMVCFHKKYDLGDKHGYDSGDFNGWVELRAYLEQEEGPLVACKPLHLFDHGGITIKTGPFHDKWDSGQVGFVFVTEEECKKGMGREGTKEERDAWAERIIEGEVETYDKYLRGDVYCFDVYDDETDEVLESCGGFFGEEYCRQEGESTLNYLLVKAEQAAFEAEELSWIEFGKLLEVAV